MNIIQRIFTSVMFGLKLWRDSFSHEQIEGRKDMMTVIKQLIINGNQMCHFHKIYSEMLRYSKICPVIYRFPIKWIISLYINNHLIIMNFKIWGKWELNKGILKDKLILNIDQMITTGSILFGDCLTLELMKYRNNREGMMLKLMIIETSNFD